MFRWRGRDGEAALGGVGDGGQDGNKQARKNR